MRWLLVAAVSIGMVAHIHAAPVDVHFGNDIVPLFSKLGCNTAGCHGKASGQNGFRLSIFGFDPVADHDALVHEARGRRIFPADPRLSLILRKATGQIAHGGGRRLEAGSADYELLLRWIEQGTPIGRADAPRPVRLHVEPASSVLGHKAELQIRATTIFSDGSVRIVTDAATYTSNQETVADADRRGRIRTGERSGEAAISVNYMGLVSAVRIQVPRTNGPKSFPILPVQNQIDELVWAKLRIMGIVPSELADDATFLRRVSLDLLGTIPTPDEVRTFLADRGASKRAGLIDRLLERHEYADFWAQKWSDILLVNRDKLGDRGAFEFHGWLRTQFARNRPYDEWVRTLVTASGDSALNGPVNFFRAAATPEDAAKAVSQAFLGIRLECAQCHHHPFEKWGQDDFYGLAGFFNGLTRKPVVKGQDVVFHAGYKETRIPLTEKLAAMRAPDESVPTTIPAGDPRSRLAVWLTSGENPWFARLAVNRLWKQFFGRGLVEPEDDLRSTNPSTNEPLLDYLAGQFVDRRFDLKAVMRLILNSRVYGLSSEPNETNRDDDQNFSRRTVRQMPAEVLLDGISSVTGVPERFPGRPLGTRAIELWDNRLPSYFLDIFGRSERLSTCACGRSSEPTMAQALHLLNAPEIEQKIAGVNGRLTRLLDANRSDDQIVDELCLAAIGRSAGDKERLAAKKLFATAPSRREAAQDFMWALLNSYDFLFVR